MNRLNSLSDIKPESIVVYQKDHKSQGPGFKFNEIQDSIIFGLVSKKNAHYYTGEAYYCITHFVSFCGQVFDVYNDDSLRRHNVKMRIASPFEVKILKKNVDSKSIACFYLGGKIEVDWEKVSGLAKKHIFDNNMVFLLGQQDKCSLISLLPADAIHCILMKSIPIIQGEQESSGDVTMKLTD